MNKHHINPFDRQILIIYLYSDLTYMAISAECDLDSAILNFARLKDINMFMSLPSVTCTGVLYVCYMCMCEWIPYNLRRLSSLMASSLS